MLPTNGEGRPKECSFFFIIRQPLGKKDTLFGRQDRFSLSTTHYTTPSMNYF
jgi:hypothetical protein